jgi:6-pyruvoyltetrahydropterin/6-carboxytetrahydropterin synthase
MIIRKKFNVESAHIVRNCTSERCSHSIHGHSAVIEVFLESNFLDNAQMVYDFGLMKSTIKQFVDSMDHCYLLCSQDSEEFKSFIKSTCDRWIELPFNPSAEMLSMFIFSGVSRILENTIFKNGEDYVRVNSVRYSETDTGYAECNIMDVTRYNNVIDFDSIIYSEGVTKDWSNDLKSLIYDDETVCNPIVEQQITLKNI